MLEDKVMSLDFSGLDKPASNPASYTDGLLCYSILASRLKFGKNKFARNWAKRHGRTESNMLTTSLALVRNKLSSNPRDKVYGLYGLFESLGIRNLPRVNYDDAVCKVFTDVAQTAIVHAKNLDLLYHVCLPSGIPGLPSWVPDWSNVGYIKFSDRKEKISSLPASYKFSLDGLRLTVTGSLVDSVQKIAISTSICTEGFRRGYAAAIKADRIAIEEQREAVAKLVRTLQSWARCSKTLDSYPTGETVQEAFYYTITQRTLPLPPGYVGGSCIKDVIQDFENILLVNESSSSTVTMATLHEHAQRVPNFPVIRNHIAAICGSDDHVESWADELRIRLYLRLFSPGVVNMQIDAALYTYHRALFTTKAGYMGIGPRWAHEGDRVALIHGLEQPFLVRPQEKGYRLIGPAHVHGIMQIQRPDEQTFEDLTFM